MLKSLIDTLSRNNLAVLRAKAIERETITAALSEQFSVAQYWTPLEGVDIESLPSQIVKTAESKGLHVFDGVLSILSRLSSIERIPVEYALQSAYDQLRRNPGTQILLIDYPLCPIPEALSDILPEVVLPFPGFDQLCQISMNHGLTDREIIFAGLGLSVAEWTEAVRQIQSQSLTGEDARQVAINYRRNLLRLEGMELLPTPHIEAIGGMDLLQEEIIRIQSHFTPAARSAGVPSPKGAILVGPSGTGKSHAAKVAAAIWGVPLINIGIDKVVSLGAEGAIYLKSLLKRIEAIGRCVVFFDEMDKFLGGTVNDLMLGVLLTWLQEHPEDCGAYVIATLNRLEKIPLELTRPGRFNKIYYIGYPEPIDRITILFLHLNKRDGRFRVIDRNNFKEEQLSPFNMEQCRAICSDLINYTGAEIEEAVNIAYSQSWQDAGQPATKVEISFDNVIHGIKTTCSLFSRDSENVEKIQNRSKQFTQPSSSIDTSTFANLHGNPFLVKPGSLK